MENLELARLVLKTAEAEMKADSGLFSMNMWVAQAACGTVACLAGHTLLQHGGYQVARPQVFADENGRMIIHDGIGREAQKLLGMSDAERYRRFGKDIFMMSGDGNALAAFRTLIDES